MKRFPTHIVAVDGAVENGTGEILLVHNRHSGQWTLPGGQVETGKNLMDALIREIREESGTEVCVGRLVCVISNTSTDQGYNGYALIPTKVMFGFACTNLGGELRGSDETSEARWVPKDRVLNYITAPCLTERYLAYLSGEDGVQYLEYVTKPDYLLKVKCRI